MKRPLNQLLTAEDIVDTVRESLVVLTADLRVMMANQSFYQTFQVRPENTQGQLLYDLGDRQWDIPALRKLMEEVLPQNAVFNDYEVEHTFPGIGHRMMLLNARRLDHSKLILLAIEDITERKQGEGELRRSSARNELILAGTEAATWDWNIPDKRVLFSPRWKQLRGFSEAEVSDSETEWNERIHPDDKDRIMEAVAAHLAGQTPLFEEEYRVRHKSGRWIWILDRGVITARDASGNVLHMTGCETDITVRKETEQALHESQEQLVALFESAPDGNVVVDRQGIIRAVNAQAERLFGYQREELVGNPVEVLVPDRLAARHVGHRNDYVSQPRTRPMGAGQQLLGKRKDGSEFPVDIMLSPVEIESGRVLAVVRDITERKQAEEAHRQSRERLAATQTHAPVGIVETTLDGAYVSVNDEFCRIIGYSKDELLKMRIHDVTHPEDWPENQDPFKRLVAGEYPWYRFEKRFLRKDGSITWADVVRRLLTDAQGRPLYVIGAILDITERKQAEEALRLSNERFNLAVKCSQVVLFQQDLELRYTWLQNPASGFEQSVAIGKRDADLMERAADAAVTEALKREVIRSGVSQRQEVLVQIGGVGRHYDLLVEPQRDAAGLISGVTCAAIDITARKQAEEARQKREQQYRALAIASSEIAYRMSADWSTLLPLDGRELFASSGRPIADWAWVDQYLPRDEHARIRQTISDAIARKDLFEMEHRVLRLDGSTGWVRSRSVPILDENEQVIGWFGAASDITERKHAEEALRESEERLGLALTGGKMGMWAWDMRTGRSVWNAMEYELLGLSEVDSPSAELFFRHVHPDDLAPMRRSLDEVTVERPDWTHEFRIVRADGALRWLAAIGKTQYGADGRPERMIGVNFDITERKQAEVEVRESQRRLAAVLDATTAIVYQVDTDSRFVLVNRRFEEVFEITAAVRGRSLYDVFPPDIAARFEANNRRVLAEGRAMEFEEVAQHSDGPHYYATVKAPLLDDGVPVGIVGVSTDITERKRAEAALRQAHAQLNDRAKHLESLVQQRTAKLQTAIGELEAFSYSVAHDLRAPLRAMEGYARELLKESSLSPQGQTYLVRIHRAAARLDRLTQEVLTYSRISQEKIKLAPVDLDRLAHELVEQYPGITAHRERIAIQSPLLPVLGHEGLLTQALSNLLINACKFVAPGASPEVVVRTEPIGEEVRLWVEDKGIGIAPEHRHRIFEMFGFGRIHPDHKYEGAGIGLAIVKKAAERMGGTVGFDSEPGKGSRFWIQLKQV